jgi:hypothetical protein
LAAAVVAVAEAGKSLWRFDVEVERAYEEGRGAEAFASTVEDVARKLNGTLDGWGIAGPSSGEKSLVEWHQQIAVRRLNRRGT